ncbi:MAG: hypothetical protein ACE5G9_05430 [Nitrospinales bacterium]
MRKGTVCGWLWMLLLFLAWETGHAGQSLKYKIIGGVPETENYFSLSQLEEAAGVRVIASAYFDWALNYRNSRLHVISFAGLVARYHGGMGADAVLLNCFDDYQGIVSLEDIRRYDLQLATRIEIAPEFKKPDWLNPLMIIVPDGGRVPYRERFVTANIREIKFVRLEDYYAPLKNIVRTAPEVESGLRAFKDNCLFCHSLRGVGGNKGVRLLDTYNFSGALGRDRFRADFFAFHGKDNADKQNLEQFVTSEEVREIGRFLRAASHSP